MPCTGLLLITQYHDHVPEISRSSRPFLVALTYTKYDITAATISVIQNACHTPTAPKTLLSRNATGSMNTMYLISDITRDALPLLRPSSAPESTTDMEEMMKPALDYPQRRSTQRDNLDIMGIDTHELLRHEQTDYGHHHHYRCHQDSGSPDYLLHPAVLPCTVIVSHQRPYALHHAVGRQIKERLELVVYAQHEHITCRIRRQYAVEHRYLHRRQRYVECCCIANGIQLFHHVNFRLPVLQPELHRERIKSVHHEVYQHRQCLSYTCGKSRPFYAHLREGRLCRISSADPVLCLLCTL